MQQFETLPPRFRVNLAERVGLTLNAIVADGETATQMADDYRVLRQKRVEAALTAARTNFLTSPQWQCIVKLREHLAELSAAADKANAELGKTQMQYQEHLKQGDPVSLLGTVQMHRTLYEQARQARDDLEREVTALEQEAAKALQAQMTEANRKLKAAAHSEMQRLLDELIGSLDKGVLVELAVLENIFLSDHLPMPMPAGLFTEAPLSTEIQGWVTLPPRAFTITRDSTHHEQKPTQQQQPQQWGPSRAAYPDQSAPSWGTVNS